MKNTLRTLNLLLLGSLIVASGCKDDSVVQYAAPDLEPEGGPEGQPEGSPEGTPEGTPEGNPEGTPEGTPEGEPEIEPVGAPDGTACAEGSECAGGVCMTEAEGYPGGYCTATDCATGASSCTGQCAFLDSTRQSSACFGVCEDDAGCREGYECRPFGDIGLCLPREPEVEELRPDGDACTSREQCAGGVCFTEDDGFPGGHCTTVNCQTREDCAGEGNACLQAGRPNFCIHLCTTGADCREGYVCQPVQGGGYCAPSPTAGTFVPEEGDLPFDVVCGETLSRADAFQGGLDAHTLRFEIPEEATSFMVVPYSPGDQIFPVELNGPGQTLNMFEEYGFALANAGFLINVTPLLVPQAPQFAEAVAGGNYSLTMAANSNLCRFVLPKSGQGSQIDLNFHFVGVRGLDAQSAEENEGFQQAIASFDRIYDPLGVQIRLIRYRDVTGDDEVRFRIVRSQEAAFQLVATSTPPGDTADEALSINVFFIDQFAIDGGSVLGISAGLPGAAGVHGMRGSGLVFSASVLGDPNLLGQVLAHEVGHYLGLFHTSEQGGQGFDPLSDTPQCSRDQWNNPNACPDITNLMFPFAGNNHTNITENQSFVVHANPLVK